MWKHIIYVSSSSIIRYQLPKASGLQWYQAPYILTICLHTVVDCEHMICHDISYCLARIPNSFYCDVYVSTSIISCCRLQMYQSKVINNEDICCGLDTERCPTIPIYWWIPSRNKVYYPHTSVYTRRTYIYEP